jgi:hypothetical protein
VVFGVCTFVFSLATYQLQNDHFDRISRGRQIAQYGELPFVDFFDPGYFLTEFSSAAAQWISGGTLTGELVLNTSFLAAGGALVLLLALRLSRSYAIAVPAAILSVLAMPRAYDFDKVLFYALGPALIYGYVARPTALTLGVLGSGIAVAGLFRYDSSVYLLCAAVTALIVVHGGDWRALATRLSQLLAVLLVWGLPFLAFVQIHGGLVNAVDQVVTYARREGERTRIDSPPTLNWKELAEFQQPESSDISVQIKWSAAVDAFGREVLARRHGLHDERPLGPLEDGWWSYRIIDTSDAHVRELQASAFVEASRGLESTTQTSRVWDGLRRAVPLFRVSLLPEPGRTSNAVSLVYYALVALPLLGIFTLAMCAHRRAIGRKEVAQVLPLIVLVGLLDMFILRDPITARVGGMAGPAAVLCAWLAGTLRPHRPVDVLTRPTRLGRVVVWTMRGVGIAALVLLVKAMSITGEWETRVTPDAIAWSHVAATFDRLSAAPADWPRLVEPRYRGIVEYVRECTHENDRILASWFFPELYYFAQRSFAGGHVVVFGEHWSEDRFQRRTIDELTARPALVVILEGAGFALHYPELDEYVRGRYRTGGVTNFGDSGLAPDHYTVLVLNDRTPTRIHAATVLPCFR